MTIENLKAEEHQLYELLKKNHEAQRALNKVAFVEKWGVDVGDEVLYKDGRSPDYKHGVVKEIVFDELHRPVTYVVFFADKDGKITKRYTRVWLQSVDPIMKKG